MKLFRISVFLLLWQSFTCCQIFAQSSLTASTAGMTSEQDHQNMMDQLGITTLRPGAEGFNVNSPTYQNTDESKANPYPNLPDPLIMDNGKPVRTARDWWRKRRPELFADFDDDIYGKTPRHTPKIVWEVASVTKEMNGSYQVVTKKLIGHVDNSLDPPITVEIHLSLSTPANALGPVPVMLEFGFPEGFPMPSFGNFPRPRAAMPASTATTQSANPMSSINIPAVGPTWQQQCLACGYGYAEIDPTSFQADNGAGLTKGIIGLCNQGKPRKPDDWGALKAWAWGVDRAIDYFESDRDVDAKQIGIEGLSRYGKATLVTMAYDPRVAIAFVGSSGEGGAKLWRRHWGEEEGNLASSGEYHWLAGNFMKYDSTLTPGDLPVDQHELIALCAPRPVFISCGSPTVEGTWLDDKGMFMATVDAGQVYTFLGKKDLGVKEMPPMETPLIDGDLAWRQHSGGHTTTPNWPTFLQFASRYLHAPTTERTSSSR